jgi:predicted permease
MRIFETLAPLVVLIGFGVLLSHLKFLGNVFIADLNKLAFWVALPALLFRSSAHATAPSEQTWLLCGILFGATLLVAGLGYGLAVLLGLPAASRGTLSQSAFRGNLAYIGIPTLTYSLSASSAAGLIPKSQLIALGLGDIAEDIGVEDPARGE